MISGKNEEKSLLGEQYPSSLSQYLNIVLTFEHFVHFSSITALSPMYERVLSLMFLTYVALIGLMYLHKLFN